MPLPLVTRKSIRDNQEHLDSAVELIKTVSGADWTFEIDFETIFSKLGDGCDYVKNDAGNFFYKEVAMSIANCVERACKQEMTKEALVEANSQSKVIIRVNEDKKNTNYWKYMFEAGSLVVIFRAPPCNVSDLTYFDLASIIPSPGALSLKARLNLKNNQEAIQESLEQIKVATKVDWSYDEESLETCYTTIDSNKDSIGEIFKEIINYVATNITKRCADEMVLEAFNEVTTNARIILRHNPKQSNYWQWIFENQNLVISFKSICNVSDNCYFDFEKLL
ncbi:hypothetical protein PPL_08056 [Heterostelium album PN500]|uniref:Uncharacterized protein n=1 Tax=Heterostelium pallidum (strain ATCC 26659 / Pp 5 / PN500) TaxID=670386 RepID=D3BIH7_HETP5|nr:hypothetical protein PPL_08056 [Heterostelium album PN500]EFA78601.1 hypothetical protein PPL_08056 [Heterostelium album PN500]|eukprot:XP_020430725.1 hypothetical protein PPL_08056 [Heterostelium album PN500]